MPPPLNQTSWNSSYILAGRQVSGVLSPVGWTGYAAGDPGSELEPLAQRLSMKKIWIGLMIMGALCLTPIARADGYACGSYYGSGCYAGVGCSAGVWLGGLGVGLYGGLGGCGLSLGVGLPGLWAGIGLGLGASGCAGPAYVGTGYTETPGHVDNPPPVPMTAAQMAGHNTRNWAPPPGPYTGPTYYWTAPPVSGSQTATAP